MILRTTLLIAILVAAGWPVALTGQQEAREVSLDEAAGASPGQHQSERPVVAVVCMPGFRSMLCMLRRPGVSVG